MFEHLAEDVRVASTLGEVCIVGDFNAHTNNCEAAADDVLDDIMRADPHGSVPSPRASPDKAPVDDRGELLLTFCQATGLAILNGREDIPGNSGTEPTSCGTTGTAVSVVDYVLYPRHELAVVQQLQVEAPDGAVSDHRALSLTVSTDLPPPAAPPPAPARRRRYMLPTDEDQLVELRAALADQFASASAAAWAALPVEDHLAHFQDALTTVLTPYLRRPPRPRASASGRPRPPWWTRRLSMLADRVHRLGRAVVALRETAHAHLGRTKQQHQEARAVFKRERRTAERAWRYNQAQQFLRLASRKPVEFWRRIHSPAPTAPPVPPAEVVPHFRALLNPVVAPLDPSTLARAPLDPPPSLQALAQPLSSEGDVVPALNALKLGKAADEHGLTAEILRLFRPCPQPLTQLLERFRQEGTPSTLGVSVLVPIYKGKGDQADLNNYRGISILPALAKLYALILERRLSGALDAAGLRADSQFGFRKHRGTTEAAFVLQAVIDNHRRPARPGRPRPPLYAVFVDFKKAFDTVQHAILWQLLRNLGVPESFVVAIESYYRVVQFKVDLPTGLTAPVSARLGVKQGCPLSPTLFGVFIESLLRDFLSEETATLALPTLLGDSVEPLLYADDLALLASTLEGMQRQLDRLHRLALRYGLTVNVAKTHAVHFRDLRSKATAAQLHLDGAAIAWVDDFRYLGLTVHHHHGFREAAKVLNNAAVNRYLGMWRRCRELGIEDANSLSLLFDSLVSSVLGYGAPIWAPLLFSCVSDPQHPPPGSTALVLERLQRRFQRAVLGFPQRTDTTLVALESHRPPLGVQWFQVTVKFVNRLLERPADSLLGRALRASVSSGADAWAGHLATWAAHLRCPLDLTALRVPIRHAAAAQPRTRAGLAQQALALADPQLPAPAVARRHALTTWLQNVHTEAGAPTLDGRRLARYLLARGLRTLEALRATTAPSSDIWTRRPLTLYDAFPLIADRSLVARTRLGLPVLGISIWDGALYDDGRTSIPDKRHRAVQFCACHTGTPTWSIAHAYSCHSPSFTFLVMNCLGVRVPSMPPSFAHQLQTPPTTWPQYIRQVSTLLHRVRNGDQHALQDLVPGHHHHRPRARTTPRPCASD